ncbi:MAG: N-acetyl-gamma-glutamyl-phosphate reductase [Clostridiales bacterium GWF2_38_85]|nr:MAG: N-acetyl-gamma-glutamyl-phosphate reductase [Clostridiales bacterium GWF2_38_85]HBL84264.1 N-acetyl-gamma-glutamyl-phosphate reductase [Clostridiales bacterium]
MIKVFIDGSAGTTGLRIHERLASCSDIQLLQIDESLRKDNNERKKMINSADIAFLCLPDVAAKEAVAMVENDNTKIIDTSTAHRTALDWSYGFPELSDKHREKIANAKRLAVPGCHASGVVATVYPLVSGGIMQADYPLCCFSLTGFSGGGKSMIAEYGDENHSSLFDSPRQYALTQKHKHMPEITAVCGLAQVPLFSPIVADYYSGMEVTIQLHACLLQKKQTVDNLYEYYKNYYKNQKLITVQLASDGYYNGFIASNDMSGKDSMKIIIGGNDDRITVTALFDNLGKGASGAAIQGMNIMSGVDETTGLLI